MQSDEINSTGTRSRSDRESILHGFAVGITTGLISYFSISLALDNILLNFAAQIVIPLAVTYRLTRDWLGTLTLVTITDTYLSFGSMFFQSIGLPMSRAILFAVTMILLLMSMYNKSCLHHAEDSQWKFPRTSVAVFFYGLILPFLLVLYSVLFCGTSANDAFGDMKFIFPLLLYYPIVRLLQKDRGTFLGWVLAIGATHVIISLILSIGPLSITDTMYQNYYGGFGEEGTDIYGRLEGIGIIRAASPAFITSLWVLFIGFLVATDAKQKLYSRFLGLAASLLSLSHFVIDYLRGPILSLIVILLLFGFSSAFKRQSRSYAVRTLMFIVMIMLAGGYAMHLIVPEGLTRILLFSGSIEDYIGEQRVEQTDRMIKAFREEPIFGKGIGSKLSGGYTRESTGLNFESQYPMILYRVGIIGFIVLMIPLMWLIAELFRKKGVVSRGLSDIEGKFRMCLLLSILTTCVAGYENPYVKTGYVALTIAMYLAYTKPVRKNCTVISQSSPGAVNGVIGA
jgi:hypothetical protein